MTLPTLIDVAIGLVLVFFILATLGSVLAEMWAAHQKWRHKLLRLTVTRLLEPYSANKFWSHALIQPLYGTVSERPAKPVDDAATPDPAPSAPAAKVAAPAPVAPVAPLAAPAPTTEQTVAKSAAPAKKSFRLVPRRVTSLVNKLRPEKADAPAYLDSKLFATIVLDVATGQGASGRLPGTLGAWEYAIRAHVPAKPGANNDLQDRLLALLRQIPADAADCGAALHAAVAHWYDEAMTRASGVYRRKLQKSLFIVGAVLAVALNCDALRIATVLYQNPALREQVAAQATVLVQENQSGGAGQTAETGDATLKEQLRDNVGQLRDLTKVGFPLGWLPVWRDNFISKPERKPAASTPAPQPAAAQPDGVLEKAGAFFKKAGRKIARTGAAFAEPGFAAYLAKLGGLLISALAVCLGAPFWFDLLGRLVKLRSSAGADAEKKTPPGTDASGGGAAALAGLLPGGSPPAGSAAAAVAAVATVPVALPSAVDALTLPGTDFDVGRAYWLAEFADKAYETDRAALAGWLKTNGFTLTAFLDEKGTQGFLAQTEGAAVLAFRGTEKKLDDWVTDAEFELIDGTPTGVPGKIHDGFAKGLGCVTAQLDQLVANLKDRRVLLHCTGHSLGAALATLAAVRYARLPQACPIHTVHTFGSPRVGNADFVREFDARFQGRAYRFVNDEDLVTRVPPREMKYDHVCDLVYIDESGKLQRDIGYWYRFLNFATNALTNLTEAVKTTVKDHSMSLYCGHLEKAARNRTTT